MRIKVHPNRHKYLAGEEACVSVTFRCDPNEYGGKKEHTWYWGAVWLKDVELRVQPAGVAKAQREGQRNVHAWAVGEAVHLFHTQYPYPPIIDGLKAGEAVWEKVTYHFDSGEFRILDTGENVTGMRFPYAHIVGRDFYILDNRSK